MTSGIHDIINRFMNNISSALLIAKLSCPPQPIGPLWVLCSEILRAAFVAPALCHYWIGQWLANVNAISNDQSLSAHLVTSIDLPQVHPFINPRFV